MLPLTQALNKKIELANQLATFEALWCSRDEVVVKQVAINDESVGAGWSFLPAVGGSRPSRHVVDARYMGG